MSAGLEVAASSLPAWGLQPQCHGSAPSPGRAGAALRPSGQRCASEQGEVPGCRRASVNERSQCYVNWLFSFTPMNQIRSGALCFIIIFFLLPFLFQSQHRSSFLFSLTLSLSSTEAGISRCMAGAKAKHRWMPASPQPFPNIFLLFMDLHPFVKRKSCSRQHVGACWVLSSDTREGSLGL